MTIDEAIEHAREVSEVREDMCAECRAEHQQLAEWLEELKRYRKEHAWAKNRAYNKAINDFEFACAKMIREEQDTRYGYLDGMDIREIAEKLKAGGKEWMKN